MEAKRSLRTGIEEGGFIPKARQFALGCQPLIMVEKWSRPFPMLKSSRKVMNFVQRFVQPAKSDFQKNFQKYILYQLGFYYLFSFVNLAVATRTDMDVFKAALDFMMALYGFVISILYRRFGKKIFQLVHKLRNGISNYSCYVVTPKEKDRLKLTSINRTAIIAEVIIALNFLIGLNDFIIVPFTFMRHEFDSSPSKLLITTFTGLPDNASFFIYVLGCILFYIPYVIFVGVFNSFWQIILINSISCLEGELKILAGFLGKIEQIANTLFEDVKVNMMFVNWSEVMRPSRSYPVWDPATTWSDADDLKLKEITLYDCLRETVLHHQNIYRCCIRLNECLKVCMFLYGQIIIFGVLLSAFLFTQEECRTTSKCLRLFLILIPPIVSQGSLFIFGQTLYNESKRIWTVLNGGNWLDKSERITLTARVMMNQAVEPIVLNAITYNLNFPGFIQVVRAIYSVLLLLSSKLMLKKLLQKNN